MFNIFTLIDGSDFKAEFVKTVPELRTNLEQRLQPGSNYDIHCNNEPIDDQYDLAKIGQLVVMITVVPTGRYTCGGA